MRRRTTPHKDELDQLLDPAADDLGRCGVAHLPAEVCLATAARMLAEAQALGWSFDLTPAAAVEQKAAARGWAFRWEEGDLVLEIPGWAPPPVRVVAVQPGLFSD